jgi:predicted HTH transcriptional regulator
MSILPDRLNDLVDVDAATLRVSSREGKYREFKQQFTGGEFSRFTKALAAFCNTNGGVLIFGIAEKPNRIEGVDPATIPDEAAWTDRLKKDFDPEIAFETRHYEVVGRTVVAIGVEPHVQRPVICKRDVTARIEKRGKFTDETIIQQGAIYYRQSGQTRPIAFTELTTLLQERDERRLSPHLSPKSAAGPV